jgi:hypothetical protein
MSSEGQLGYLGGNAQQRNPFNYAKFEQLTRDNTTAWLTAAELRAQINLYDDTSQDTYITSLELATRQAIEDFIGLSIFSVKYRVWYNAASLMGVPLTLDLPEVSQNADELLAGVTVNTVKYWDDNTPPVLHTVDPDTYFYDESGNKIVLQTLPTELNSLMTSPVYAEYTTAPSPLADYEVIKLAGKLLFTHFYNNRSDTGDGNLKTIPFGVQTLLRPYKPLVM